MPTPITARKPTPKRPGASREWRARERAANRRNWIAVASYAAAIPAAWLHPALPFIPGSFRPAAGRGPHRGC